MPSADVSALEKLLARKKELASLLVCLDGYSRWGGGSDEAWANGARTRAEEHPRVTAQLEKKIAELKKSRPAAIVQWAEAHVAVLDDFLERVPKDGTKAFVAREEREQWIDVREGKRDYVEENPVYVHPDPELYQRLFGFIPPKLHW